MGRVGRLCRAGDGAYDALVYRRNPATWVYAFIAAFALLLGFA